MAEYFVTEGEQPTEHGSFVQIDDVPAISFAPGLDFRPVLGQNVLVNHVYFQPHTEAPTHVHVEEQIIVVLDGALEVFCDGETRLLRRGGIAVIPPWVPHAARTLDEPCVELDIFCPPRQQLLDALRAKDGDGADSRTE